MQYFVDWNKEALKKKNEIKTTKKNYGNLQKQISENAVA